MKLNLLVLMLLSVFGASQAVRADILIEPYVGYQMGKADDGSGSDNTNGTTFGGRLGYSSMLGLQLGADYMAGNYSADPYDGGSSYAFEPTSLGAFIAFDFPVLLRVYAAYFFSTEAKVQGLTDDLEGTSIKLGLGFTMLPLVHINLEYMTSEFGKSDNPTMPSDLKVNLYGVSVSLPLTL